MLSTTDNENETSELGNSFVDRRILPREEQPKSRILEEDLESITCAIFDARCKLNKPKLEAQIKASSPKMFMDFIVWIVILAQVLGILYVFKRVEHYRTEMQVLELKVTDIQKSAEAFKEAHKLKK